MNLNPISNMVESRQSPLDRLLFVVNKHLTEFWLNIYK